MHFKSLHFHSFIHSFIQDTVSAHRAHTTVKLLQDARVHITWQVVSYLLKNAKYDS